MDTQDPNEEAAAKLAALEAQQKREEELKKLTMTPITKDELEKRLADANIDLAKMLIVRQKAMTQLNQLQLHISSVDEQIGLIKMDVAVLERRALNAAESE